MMARSAAMARDLRTLYSAGTFGNLADGQLLERFATRHGEAAEAAFTALVERHGPMVLGVCRRLLADPRDVEDAFQATFLVLVKKAPSVRVDDSLGRWLYGVTRRVAGRTRAIAARRRVREGEALVDRAGPEIDVNQDRLDLRDMLDEELGRLPEKYRVPMVLCYLEGLTHDVAAAQLGWPVGTVRGRLARARERLRTRLAGRGLVPTAVAVPPALVESTVRAAIRLAAARGGTSAASVVLAAGVSRTMVVSKLTSVAVALVVVSAAVPVFLAGSGPGRPDDSKRPAEARGAAAGPGRQIPFPNRSFADVVTSVTEAPTGRFMAGIGKDSPARPVQSKMADEAIKLAERAFGPKHWAADPDVGMRYYNRDHGYWMYARRYNRLNDGKQLRLEPFAIVWKAHDGKGPELVTATGDRTIIDLDQPLGPGDIMKVLRARVEGNVEIRDDRGTPDDRADDLVVGPLPSVEYDAAALDIRSETAAAIQDRGMRISGFGLEMKLRAADANNGRVGVDAISLRSQVHVAAAADRPGLLSGKAGPTLLEVRCAGALRMDLPAPRRDAAIGPPAPSSSLTEMAFSREVVVSWSAAGEGDQISCDTLQLRLQAAPPRLPISLREARATGHAVELRSKRRELTARCTELTYKKPSPDQAGETHLRGDAQSALRIETGTIGPEGQGHVTKIEAPEAIIVETGQGSDDIRIIGPASVETRPRPRPVLVPGPPAGHRATAQDGLTVKTEIGPDGRPMKGITLKGNPEFSSAQATLSAEESITIWFEGGVEIGP